jgi:hypothetical protein
MNTTSLNTLVITAGMNMYLSYVLLSLSSLCVQQQVECQEVMNEVFFHLTLLFLRKI